jgi:glycosyltransferase involved in cell wall biosynthesis
MRVVLVIPIFNEALVLPQLLTRLESLRARLETHSLDTIFIDDGSRDASATLISAHSGTHAPSPWLHLVRLSRNFGHQAALSAGLVHSATLAPDAVVTLDADLQDPPELIPELLAAHANGADVVLAVRRSRQERGLRRLGFDLFHKLFGSVVDQPIERNTGTFGLLSRDALDAFLQLRERHRFFPGLRSWIGFTRAEVVYDRQERAAGEPAVTFRKLVRYALDGVFSFSHLPLRLVSYAGLFSAGVGFAVAIFFAAKRLLGLESAFTGFTTLVTLVLFLGGVQLVAIGILGEYLGRIYDEVKQRPHFIVRPKRPASSSDPSA